MKNSIGFMYIAKRPCGRVSAASWDDKGREKDIAKSVASWIRRGDTVERIERFQGDDLPQWACCSAKECNKEGKK